MALIKKTQVTDTIMKIVIDNKIPFIQGVLEPIAQVEYLSSAAISSQSIKDADAMIIRTRSHCGAQLLEGSNVRFIASATIGFDHIDVEYCHSRNIYWTTAPGCNAYSVQQYIASALLELAAENDFSLAHKTIGIVGVGNVGSKVAKLAETLGMQILLNDPPREKEEKTDRFTSLEQIKKEADIISFHVPLNKGGDHPTYHMVNEIFLEDLRRTAWIINSSRGAVMDNDALKAALRSGKLAGAVLDVWKDEPHVDIELLEHVKWATPHIAGHSADGKANGTAMSIRALSKFFNLGLDDWYPQNIPTPLNSSISIDCTQNTSQNIIRSAVNATYDIRMDDQRFRNSPQTFEQQRNDYPPRREPPAYCIL